MQSLNDFVLLKALFNQELSEAVMAKDKEKILSIVGEKYKFEVENEFVSDSEIDVNTIAEIHAEELQDERLLQALI